MGTIWRLSATMLLLMMYSALLDAHREHKVRFAFVNNTLYFIVGLYLYIIYSIILLFIFYIGPQHCAVSG